MARPLRLPPIERNGRLILAAKAARAFAFGLNAVALGLYLEELGLPGEQVGLVFAGALAGTMLLTLVIALRGDRIGRRRLLVVGSLLMVLALLIPVAGSAPAVLALLGLSGMVAVTSNESTGLHSVDQAILPADGRRQATERQPSRCTASSRSGPPRSGRRRLARSPRWASGSALSDRIGTCRPSGPTRSRASWPRSSPRGSTREPRSASDIERGSRSSARGGWSRGLSALFALDAFAGGLVVQSFLAFWFASRFALDPGDLGGLFFAAKPPGRRLVPGRSPAGRPLRPDPDTMVFTHIPSSLLLIGWPLVAEPRRWRIAAVLFLRPVAAVVDGRPDPPVVRHGRRRPRGADSDRRRDIARTERGASAGAVRGRVAARCRSVSGAPLIACGVLKIVYDLLLFAAFKARPAPGERGAEPVGWSGRPATRSDDPEPDPGEDDDDERARAPRTRTA